MAEASAASPVFAQRMKPAMPGWLPLLLGFLTAIGPVSTDMYLPAFPAIEADLGAGWGGAQATLAAWFAVPLGLLVGVVSLVAAAQAFAPGDPRPRQEGTAVGTARP